MTWLDLHDINAMTGGVLHGKNLMTDGISIDTRTILPNRLFVALRGNNHDGHDFVADGIRSGAAAVMTERQLTIPVPQLIVQDSLYALQQLAVAWRQHVKPIMIALTGSNGKTTTREMLVAILKLCSKVCATRGNLNNHIGVPLSLLELRHEHEVAVIELGANHSGEIRQLARWVQADIGLITNAGAAHLEGFGSIDGVAHAKGELLRELRASATAILNADDAYYGYWRSLLKTQRCISFGSNENVEVGGDRNHDFIRLGGQSYAVTLQMAGRHNFQNAMAAAAAAQAMGIAPQTIVQGLANAAPVAGRMNKRCGIRGSCLWDDTYNANPASLSAALDVISDVPGSKWLILGNMAELGNSVRQWHADAGKTAREKGIDRLFTIGDFAACAATSFGVNAKHFSDARALIRHIAAAVDHDTTVLIKGSRSAGMENIVTALAAPETQA